MAYRIETQTIELFNDFSNELEKSLSTAARKEPLYKTNYSACQCIVTEFIKIIRYTWLSKKDSSLEQSVFFSLNGYSTLNKMIELTVTRDKPVLASER
ncbi:unnamed protein product [Rotaria sordida]|uniref:Uncharacterized protein n=1 Tax=Rotaria sordida TaxID=392033 RepID=A0A815KPD5_9BILA|nr:unnamed protein product [Rotaria sordida]CAF1153937.1 unnamed protein product [Rotaria sordida]CAF1395758.1 unnamed protein product [Rotaria sordida]CAF3765567.1 unnamed protein product [Rotaria sordida]